MQAQAPRTISSGWPAVVHTSVGAHAPARRRPAADRTPPNASCERLFLEELPTIQRITSTIAARHRLPRMEADDFASDVRVRIIADDYAVLRKFRGQCALRTYLTVVIQRMFQDYRNAQWGKWRPSARSRRDGNVAVLLERLTLRDGLTLDEARTTLETNHRLAVTDDVVDRVAADFRMRGRPRFIAEEQLRDVPGTATADEAVADADAHRIAVRAMDALAAAVRAVSPQDRLVLALRFCDGLSVAAIARRLGLDQKRLYRRIGQALICLRASLESAGIGPETLAAFGCLDSDAAGVFRNIVLGSRIGVS